MTAANSSNHADHNLHFQSDMRAAPAIATPPDSPDIAPLDPMLRHPVSDSDLDAVHVDAYSLGRDQGSLASGSMMMPMPIPPSVSKANMLKERQHHPQHPKSKHDAYDSGTISDSPPSTSPTRHDRGQDANAIAPAADYLGRQPSPSQANLDPTRSTTTLFHKPAPASAAATDSLADIERFIELSRLALQIPGLTISVSHNTRPIMHRAFGSLSAASPSQLMSTSTLTDLCSLTKAFTSAAAAKLVHQGRLDWQMPITHYVPDLAFSDPLASSAITMLDLLSHRTGLAAHDELWTGSSRALRAGGDLIDIVPWLEFGGHFRASYIFSHVGYAIATLVIERVAGEPFEAYVTRELLAPLGMTGVRWRYPGAKRKVVDNDGAIARPHQCVWLKDPNAMHAFRADVVADLHQFVDDVHPDKVTDGLAHAAEYSVPVHETLAYAETNRYMAGAAGVMYASADDVAKWAACWLNGGLAPDGKTQVLHEMSVLTRVHNSSDLYESEAEARRGMRVIGYACGWEVNQFGDHELLMHTGGSPGYATLLALVPGANLSIYIAENQSFTSLSSILLPLLLHTLIPPSTKSKSIRPFTLADACAALPRVKLNMILAHAKAHLSVAPTPAADPAVLDDASELVLGMDQHTLSAVAGVYKHDAYGYVTIALDTPAAAHTNAQGLRLIRAPDVNTRMYPARALEEPGCLTLFTYPAHTLYWFRKVRESGEDRYVRQARRGFVDGDDEEHDRFELVMREESTYVEVVFTRVD
ncbi:beta-lactamase/transpeptidase-like protein [Catenaria anguillulae PL171]|uniref:Beta-lactamase/transpeptidase-like protein n=1 Tax=Catenaria anguillulae PL171 TaxID=765915 RepID=A0A1Y2HT33_9FUNG|nr:beta-lactamase/transpeptidase-like protein [Catenaria anguillulae PL171]